MRGDLWVHPEQTACEHRLILPDVVAHEIIGHGHGVVRAFTLLRALRVLRIFAEVDQFRTIFQAFFELTPVFSRLGSVLLIIMMVFGQLGILLFGGEMQRLRGRLSIK